MFEVEVLVILNQQKHVGKTSDSVVMIYVYICIHNCCRYMNMCLYIYIYTSLSVKGDVPHVFERKACNCFVCVAG